MSVLTASDREGLKPMAAGLMKRHSDAGVSPPTVLYVDHDCRRGIAMETKRLLSQCLRWKYPSTYGTLWDALLLVALQSQPKYAIFLGRLFHCTFKWSQEDPKPLIPAIHCKLTRSGVKDPSEEDVIKKSAKKSLRPIATEKPLVWKKQLTWSMTWWTDFKMSKEMTL